MMKTIFSSRTAVAAALAALSFSAAAQTQLVTNGSFSSGAGGLGSWTTTGNVNVVGGTAELNDGEGPADSITQIITGVLGGTSLAFSFDYDKRTNGTPNTPLLGYALEYSIDGFSTSPNLVVQSFSGSVADGTKTFGPYVLPTTEPTYSVRIRFAGLNGEISTRVDNVSLLATAPVPEPESYALALAGLGVLGVVARRRRNRAAC